MTNTIPNVPRELLERLCIASDECRDNPLALFALTEELRGLLSAPSPAGVDGLEAVAQVVIDPNGSNKRVIFHSTKALHGLPVWTKLSVTADAQAIIDGLRGEADQQAQRIGELASHLEFAVTMLTVAGLAGNAQVEAMRAALSAGKEVK